MKSNPLVFLAIVACTAFVRSQDEPTAASRESSAVPAASPTTAHILGPIPDGTPPPPAEPKPEHRIAARDILSTKASPQGGRTITVREIKPIALPQPPVPVAVETTAADREYFKQLKAYEDANPRSGMLCLGATVFRSDGLPTRSLVRHWSMDTRREITFWSSADFFLIAGGIGSFTDTAGMTHCIFMSWSQMKADRGTMLRAVGDLLDQAPEFPAFPSGKATFQIIGDPPAADDLTAIQSLHDLYNSEYQRLLTAYQGRERVRLQQEAYLKANPPQPKDITLTYWRTEKPAPQKGASK